MPFSSGCSLLTIFLIYMLCRAVNAAQTKAIVTVNISLATYDEFNQGAQVFSANPNPTFGTGHEMLVTVTNAHQRIQYFIVQIHSFQTNVALSYYSNFSSSASVNGTNVGLVQKADQEAAYKFYVKAEDHDQINHILILVVAYPNNVPIPGGCNMEFMVETAPYQRLKYTDDLVTVDAQGASMKGFYCENVIVNYKMYHMYLQERDYTPETYFAELQKMITVENITTWGLEAHKNVPNHQLRTLYSTYKGVGAVYVLVVSFGNYSAAYVPITTYACNASDWAQSCTGPVTGFSTFLCIFFFFMGLFVCFLGHKFFKTEMFLIGLLFGSYLSYMGFTYLEVFNETDTIITSASVGVILGFLCLSFWWFCGIPVLSKLLGIIILGVIYSALIFQYILGDINIFSSDLNFWGVYSCLILIVVIILTGLGHTTYIAVCSALGSLATTLSIDYWMGSNVRYIFVNVARRLTVDKFEHAVLDGPLQHRDTFIIFGWLVLFTFGFKFQLKQQKDQPPFPLPPFRRPYANTLGERTPLMTAASSSLT